MLQEYLLLPNRVVVCCHGADGLEIFGINTKLGMNSWDKFEPLAIAQGFEVIVLDLINDNFYNCDVVIKDVIDSLPSDAEIHLLGHSMGGLSSRLYLKRYGVSRITSYIALDSPEYGDKKPFLNLQCWPTSLFIKELNKDDPTPGAIPYIQLTARYPQVLPGALYYAFPNVEHVDMVTNDDVLAMTLKLLNRNYSDMQSNGGFGF